MTKPAWVRLLFGAVLAIAAPALSAQDADEVRTYDVGVLCAAVVEEDQPPAWPIRPLWTPPPLRGAITWGEDLERNDGGATITSLVRFALEALGESNTHVTVIPPTLLKVNGPPRAQRAIGPILEELGRVLDRRIDLELSIVSDAASKPTPVSRRRVRAGAEVSFEALVRRAYVGGYVATVAKRSRTFDPRVDRVDCGRRAIVRVDPAPDGALVVTVKVEETGLEAPIRALTLPLEAAAAIELPVASWSATSASARIENGGALIIGNDAVPGSFWVVRVHAAPTPPPSDRAAVELLPAGAALQPALRRARRSRSTLRCLRDGLREMRSRARTRPITCETRPRGCGLNYSSISSGPSAGAGVRWIATPPRSSAIGWVWAPTPPSRAAARAVVGRIVADATRTFANRGEARDRLSRELADPERRKPRPRSRKDSRSGPHPSRSPAIASSCSGDGCTPT